MFLLMVYYIPSQKIIVYKMEKPHAHKEQLLDNFGNGSFKT